LHFAASCPGPAGTQTVEWLLQKGIPWGAQDTRREIAEDVARSSRNEASRKVLREWAIRKEYEIFYKATRPEENPDNEKPFTILRLDIVRKNKAFCASQVLFTNPDGAPEDEIAMVTVPGGEGIMMEWERPIMLKTAQLLLDGMPKSGLRVLNIGFGIGMIDTYFQEAHPAEHVIIEGHPTCLGYMKHKGWYDRPGVRVLEGRWQDIFRVPDDVDDSLSPQLADYAKSLYPSKRDPSIDMTVPLDIGKFDIVYFDTFNEGYRGHFAFIKQVPRLLRGPNSRFSYFNGHGEKREMQYKIYAEVARLHHNDLGMNTEVFDVYVDPKTEWQKINERGRGKHCHQFPHLIPICMLAPTVPRTHVPGVGWNSSPSQVVGDETLSMTPTSSPVLV